ncbi:MAG TPA: hypothetical protein VIJ75_07215 [Hanamia sp.]
MKNKNISRNDRLSDEIDSPYDRQEMTEEVMEVKIPDGSEIPGQENFVPAPLGELADTTISSSDEEGDELFDDDIDEDIKNNPTSNVSAIEKEDLRKAANDMPGDDENLRKAALDSTDENGIPLNEGSFKKNISATDLDIPGAQLDDADEKIGEEDEENNDYSLGADNDIIPEDEF